MLIENRIIHFGKEIGYSKKVKVLHILVIKMWRSHFTFYYFTLYIFITCFMILSFSKEKSSVGQSVIWNFSKSPNDIVVLVNQTSIGFTKSKLGFQFFQIHSLRNYWWFQVERLKWIFKITVENKNSDFTEIPRNLFRWCKYFEDKGRFFEIHFRFSYTSDWLRMLKLNVW